MRKEDIIPVSPTSSIGTNDIVFLLLTSGIKSPLLRLRFADPRPGDGREEPTLEAGIFWSIGRMPPTRDLTPGQSIPHDRPSATRRTWRQTQQNLPPRSRQPAETTERETYRTSGRLPTESRAPKPAQERRMERGQDKVLVGCWRSA